MPQPTPTERTRRLTKTERMHASYFLDAMHQIEYDILTHVFAFGAVPKDWHEIAMDPNPAKARVTLRVDADVVKFFRAMGHGYQARMNRVLRAFMEGRLGKMIEGPDTTDSVTKAEEMIAKGVGRPEFGEVAQGMADAAAMAAEIRMSGEIEAMRVLVREFDANSGVKGKG
jgi:uncharacterized protein (DUF4415 family)